MNNHNQAEEYISMGIGLMQRQKYAEAKELFEKAIDVEPGNFDAYMNLGNASVNAGNLNDAEVAFKNAVTADSNSGEALFSLGNIYYLQNNYRKAILNYNKAEAAGFILVDMYLIMAQIFAEANDFEQTMRNLNRALQIQPLDGSIWRKKISLLIEAGKKEAAQEALDEFVQLLPDALDAYELQTRLLCEDEKYTEALKRIDVLAERFPEDPQIDMLKLYVYDLSEDTEKALATINRIKKKTVHGESRKTVCMHETKLLLAENKVDEAIASIDWALQELPEDSELLFLKLSIYTNSLEYEKIVSFSEQLTSKDNISANVKVSAEFYRALALKELGKAELSTAELRKLSKELRKISIDTPGMSDIYMLRLLCHCQLGEFDEAFALADYLQNISPDTAEGHAYRHLIYKQMGNEEMSKKELEEARKINPKIVG